MFKVFYSWQSDLPNGINRGFIDKGLQHACAKLTTTKGAAVEGVVDRDTLGASGAPDIKEMILAKIADADAFVADVSIVNQPKDEQTSSMRVSPNPNVLVETGYALSCLGPESLVLVCNSYFGQIDSLPFDLRGMRLLQYRLGPGEDKKAEAAKFQSALAGAIEAVARVVRSDHVYSLLYQHSTRMAGQVTGMIGDLLKIASVAGLEASLEITQEQVQTVCRAVPMSAQFPLLIGDLPERGGRYATVIEGLKHWRGHSKENFQRLMVFSSAVKPEHLVLAANVEHSSFYALLDQLPSNVGGTLEFMSSMLFSQVQAAYKLQQYAERYLARRAGIL
ncbi:hypothetical protein AVHY2522_00420 [Acidovorax sp. SUPP2522]|uniref:hypothetical protein n=1 Tax=unclassified Acidovorax TaxID=2684926 RepID=UPI00234A032B|nr:MULTISPECIES: hypothetical protein [unclassified Acidovorax]WCM97671.1 hypothetical protein M5C96_25385 [Acidovorax sp. GBBC 1281]GKT13264.1 hypothetical protein AVHY2522_00420 [Acidovorax sp. SUPP2522]